MYLLCSSWNCHSQWRENKDFNVFGAEVYVGGGVLNGRDSEAEKIIQDVVQIPKKV